MVTFFKTPSEITPQAKKLLDVLETVRGAWVTRAFIAKQLNKNRLNPYDAALLESLARKGLIEIEQRPLLGPVTYQWVYRAK